MLAITTQPFNSGNSQALRLPKAFAYPDNTPLIMKKMGDKLVIEPLKTLADVPDIFAKLGESMGEDLANFQREEFIDNERAW